MKSTLSVFLAVIILVSVIPFSEATNDVKISEDNQTIIPVQSAEATSTLIDEYGKVYNADCLIDGDITTCWCEGVDGYGKKESVYLTFDRAYYISEISFNIGWAVNNEMYYYNSRPKTVRLEYSSGDMVIELSDKNGDQVYSLPQTVITSWMRIVICDVYKGTAKDTCISEVQLVGSSELAFGVYEQDNDPTNGKEPIDWLILTIDDNNVLLISKYVLDCQPYHESGTDITWENCTLRTWLNETFLQTSFSSDEKKYIVTKTITADENPKFDTNPGNNTSDSIFLISIMEVKKYFSDLNIHCDPTEYAKEKLSYIDFGNCWWWWLRSPGGSSDAAAVILLYGDIDYDGSDVFRYNGIRPALWVNFGS